MKIAFILFLVAFTCVNAYSQSNSLKYIIEAPDGSTAMTVSNLTDVSMELESKMDFYKYQLLDIRTSEPVLSRSNRGKNCIVNISEIIPGSYNLRFFTKSFIVTTKIEVGSFANGRIAGYAYADND